MVTYPIDWLETAIGECVQIHQGGTPRTTDATFWNGDIVWLTPGEITKHDDLFIDNSERKITKKGLEHSSAELLPAGTILLCTRATIGDLAIAAIPLATNQGFKNLVCKKQIDNIFFSYLLRFYKEEMIAKSIGTTFLEISKKELSKIEICIPHFKEQIVIAKALRCFDIYIADLAELIEKKRGIRDGALEDLISGRTRLEGFEKTWSEKKLRDLCTLITKQTGFDYSNEIKASLMEYRTTNSLPFIQNKDFEGFTINFQTDFYIPCDIAIKYPKIVLDEECLLISISGRIGNVAVFNNKETAFAGGAVGVAKLIDPALATWCMLYISSSLGQEQIFANEKVGAQHNLTVEDVRNLIIKLPKSEEREAIVATIKSMDEEIEALEIERDKMIQIREGAMEDLLTGRVRLSV